ncbi:MULTISPECIES: HupE/UreJ family protein [unclassified Novosphingobium]|uniref:HupE/UreJ family protein n=1 Tax=unclassified Novosphingobium TaxID=2644732 RepID=UPI0025E59EDE|nr:MULTISPECIES: HupE/UreJ family protein [unclassified Novosphingobium]HQV02823.1 HupE/UreJ family protein [Novosphingobium sp.]
MTRLLRLVLALFAALLALPAHADELRPGYLEFSQQDAQHWKLVWKAPVLGGLATRTRPAFPDFCTQSPPQARVEGLVLVAESRLTCSKDLAGSRVGLAGMDAAFTDALLRVAPLGRPVQAARLTQDKAMVEIALVPDGWEVARSYFVLGIIHILEGYDHLLFVIALVLLIGRFGMVVKAATAFTVAHSITLVGSTLGLVGLAQAPVEALIALSIVFLAVEIVKQNPEAPNLAERAPWIVAFLFGLIHGFGFAGALREIGLPESDVPTALLTFNLGVEAGQLVIVAAVMLAITALRRFAPKQLRPATVVSTYAIGITASFWFIERLIG